MSNQLCKAKRLYIQVGDDCFPSPDTAAFVEAVKQDTWEAGEERYMYVIEGNMSSSIDKEELQLNTIPIGSVEFVQNFLKQNSLPPLKAVNVPPELNDVRFLSRKVWVCPDRAMVEEMAKLVSLSSCTVDVAVLANGQTVLIEVHPFISCGLYGFEGPDLLRMVSAAWNHQIQSM